MRLFRLMGRPATRAGDPDAATTRRVGWRLAALTVGLIVALLLVLGGAVYLTMQNVLLSSLQKTVLMRTQSFQTYLGGPGAQPGGGPQGGQGLQPGGGLQGGQGARPGGGGGPHSGRPPSYIGDVRFVIATQNLTVVQGPNPDPDALKKLPDVGTAQQVLNHHTASTWSTQQVDNTGPYLIYTRPVSITQADGSVVPGVLQAIISKQQYVAGLRSLLRVLLEVSGGGVLAAALISGLLARRALGPIQLALRRQRDFVADAAHELRTPLAIQRTAMELGLATDAVGEQQDAIEQALAQNVHLARLVDSLSLLARADSGAMTLERAPIDLARLASETASGVAVLAEEREVRLHVEAAERTCVLGDVGRLRQVLLILLDNALKYTPDGGTIDVRVARQGTQARLQVHDSGPGIAPEDLPHLFERFYRADRARSSGGMGLGLAIGRWIAEAHGGHIAAANAAEGGALFTVTLPLGG